MRKKNSFIKLLQTHLNQLYQAENQLDTYLPVMIDYSRSSNLRNALITQHDQTKQHIKRLKKIFKLLKKQNTTLPLDINHAVEGLIYEAIHLRERFVQAEVSDFALATVWQQLEHYEISCYRQAILLSKYLHLPAIESLLKASLEEDEATHKILSEIEREELTTPLPRPTSILLLMKKPNYL